MVRRLYLLLALSLAILALGLFLLGQPSRSPVASASLTARVRVAHAVPDAPPVNVAVNGMPVPALSGIAFKDVTAYVDVPAETFTVTVIVPSLGSTPVLTEILTVTEGHDYTVAAHGTVNPLDTYPLKLLVATDNNQVPPLGKARARFLHLIPGGPTVDVAIKDGPVLLSGVSYGQVTAYIEVDAGDYDLELRTVLGPIPVPGVTADANTIYSFFAVGTLVSPDILPVVDAQYVRVRAFHGISDAPPVDVWLDGDKAFESVAYKDLTAYVAVMSGTYTLGLAHVGEPVPVLTQMLVLTGGMDFTIAAAGTLTVTDPNIAELLPYVDDNRPPLAGKAHVRLIHLVPDAPFPVNVGVTGVVTPLFTGVTYKQATAYLPVDAGMVDLVVDLASSPIIPISALPNVVFEDGVIYTGFAVGLAAGLAPVEVVGLTQRFTVYLPLVVKSP